MKKKNPISVYIVAFALFAVGVGWLIYSGVSENSTYFINVAEALDMKPEELSRARLFGSVAAENVQKSVSPAGVAFTLEDKMNKEKSMRVEYAGVVPDTFKPGVEVIIEGGYDQAQQVFRAKMLMTKCPSKYKKQSEEMDQNKA